MGAVEQPVEDGVGYRRLTESLVPERHGNLARDDRRPQAGAILHDLEEVRRLGVGEGLEGEVVEDEDVDPGPARQQPRQPAVGRRSVSVADTPLGAHGLDSRDQLAGHQRRGSEILASQSQSLILDHERFGDRPG